MATFHITAARQGPNPVRPFHWNGSIRGGEDFKVAFRVLDGDGETPLHLADPRGVLSLYWIEPRPRACSDYGLGWLTGRSRPVATAASFQITDETGRLNFMLSAASTSGLHGQYGLVLEVDDFDGVNVQMEGVLQVRPGVAPATVPRVYFQPGITPIGIGLIPPRTINGLPTDADGFPLPFVPYVPPLAGDTPEDSSILGVGVLGEMILGGPV